MSYGEVYGARGLHKHMSTLRRALGRAPERARRGAHRLSALHALEADMNASFGSPTYFAGDGHAMPRPILTGAARIRPALTALLAA